MGRPTGGLGFVVVTGLSVRASGCNVESDTPPLPPVSMGQGDYQQQHSPTAQAPRLWRPPNIPLCLESGLILAIHSPRRGISVLNGTL